MAEHLSDKAAKPAAKALTALPGNTAPVPGPSTNPATNLLITDLVMRGGGRLMRVAMQKGLLRTRFDPEFAKEMVENRSLVSTLASYGAAKVATRSVPGALLVGGGLLVKTLFDRSQSKRKARRSGDKTLRKMAKEK